MEARSEAAVVSVIVPCRGHAREIQDCLHGIVRHSLGIPYEIIVVDSESDPEVAKAVDDLASVRLVRSDTPLYPGDARNLGAQHAKGRYLAFIDADAIPQPGWLTTAVAALENGSVMVSGPILDVLPLHPIAVPDNLIQFVESSPGRPDGPAVYFPGCHFAVSRTAFEAAGGFPAGVRIGEDIAFTSAIAERWPDKVHFLQRMRVRHLGRRTLPTYWEHQRTFGYHRALMGQNLKPIHQRLGRWPFMGMAIAGKRFTYIVRLAAQWNPNALLRLVVLWPSLLVGLAAFAAGFQQGCREAAKRAS